MKQCILTISLLAIEVASALSWECPADSSQCLPGEKHKDFASPETDAYSACLDYQSSSCCSAEFTQQLNQSTVTYIQDGDDIFNWSHCGAISEECETYMIEVECLYRCDPNMIYFAGAYPSSLDRVPICGQYCNHWFEACKDDLTCVTNWVFDWEYNNGTNTCPTNSSCSTFEERYGNSTRLCNVLWGNSFNYTEENTLCLTPNYAEVNTLVTEAIFAEECDDSVNGVGDMHSKRAMVWAVAAVLYGFCHF